MASSCALRRGRFESLEQRQLLAGDVVVSVLDGNLMVQGDELDNKIMITAGAQPGEFVITGLDGTTVHEEGQPPAADVTVADVHNVRVGLGDGNDLIAVVGAELSGSLGIRTGAGDDRVLIGTGGDAAELVGQLPGDLSVAVRGSVLIGTNGGDDQVSVDDAMIGGRLGVEAGADDDSVALGSTAALDPMAAARLSVRGGVQVNLGQGNDELSMDQLRARGAIVVHGGHGDDTIDATLTKSAALAAFGGSGVDAITLAQIEAHHLGVHTGEGNDSVDVRDSVFTALGVSLGTGDDTLTTADLQARVAIMLGGEGEDTLDVVSDNSFAHELIRGFEIPPDVNTHGLLFARRPLSRFLGRLR
jgi:hypothetical protein